MQANRLFSLIKIMRWWKLYLTLFAIFISALPLHFANSVAIASTVHDAISKHVPDAQIVGQTRLKVMMFDIYDATLYAPHGKWHPNKAFALKLQYLRSFKSTDLAKRTIEEMRRQGFDQPQQLVDWHARLTRLFPNVKQDDIIIGVRTSEGFAKFWLNQTPIGEINDPLFTEHFFAIWLGEKSSQPTMRNRLLGIKS